MGQLDKNLANKGTKSQGSKPKAARFNDLQFVQYELDNAQKAELKSINATADQIFDDILSAIVDGYKFGVKFDDYSQSYAVFMQSVEPGSINGGFILTGRGSTPLKAFKQVLYKHTVCLDREWGNYVERRSGDEIDD